MLSVCARICKGESTNNLENRRRKKNGDGPKLAWLAG